MPPEEGDAPAIPMQGTQVQSLFRELKSHKLHSVVKKKKIFFLKESRQILYFRKISILNVRFFCLMGKNRKLNYPENSAIQSY